MTKVGVVLGAGGLVGMAYHGGTLAALHQAGFDARNASVIVGTSAGSVVGTTVRAGFPPRDLLARAEGRPVSADAARVSSRRGTPPRMRVAMDARSLRPASPLLALRGVGRPGVLLAGMLPEGSIPNDDIVARVRDMTGGRWPDRPLWICAVRLSDGARVVFGRDRSDVDIGAAVAASSAIPGFFRPVVIDGDKYVDGGVHSPTNADLADHDLDLVVISSPMSATPAALRRPSLSARSLGALALRREAGRLRRRGIPTLILQPTPDDVAIMGNNAMDPGRVGAVARQAFDSAIARLADPRIADRLATLRAAR